MKKNIIIILGKCDPEDYPIQPKKHSLEFLRENAHLRIRTNTFSSIFRIRSSISYAIHKYFKESGFVYINTVQPWEKDKLQEIEPHHKHLL